MNESPDATPQEPPQPPGRRDPVLAAFVGWLLPGFGHFYAGRFLKGLFYLVLVGATFAGGLWLSRGLCVNPEREPVWFIGQAFAGAPAGVVAWMTRYILPTQRIVTFDVGLLYTTIAGLLNLIAISDALGIVDARNRTWSAWRREWALAHEPPDAALAPDAAASSTPSTPDSGNTPAPDVSAAPAASRSDDASAAIPPWETPPTSRAESPR